MLNWVLSILVHKDVLTTEEATHLAKELQTKTHPTAFRDAYPVIEKLLKEVK